MQVRSDLHPGGAHALAAGLTRPIDVTIDGHAGYYCAGMNQEGLVTVNGNVGTGVAENMMSGMVRVRGDASQSAGATAHGGLLIIEGDASARCARRCAASSVNSMESTMHRKMPFTHTATRKASTTSSAWRAA